MQLRKIILFPTLIAISLLSSCSSNDQGGIKYQELVPQEIDDNYLNFYQIFPISFADGNGDGKGDLMGVTAKLDYLKEMNYNGIWLCPIHPSDTSHHYDVKDYKDVASAFGGLSAFDELIREAHARGIKVIIDMVLNHSSDQNILFTESYAAAKKGKTTWDEYKRYHWISCTGAAPAGYSKVSDSDKVAYESVFDRSMPDFNIEQLLADLKDNGTSALADYFKEVFKFWLVDHDCDGFRLDATSHYVENDTSKNKEFLTWLNTECKTLKPSCYIVGEASWTSNSLENQEYQESGVDSFFQFANSAKNTGYVQQIVVQQSAKVLATALKRNRENANGGIEAPFLGNHDTPRYVGGVSGRGNPENAKFALGMLQQLGGATFTYYGDEVAMGTQSTTMDGYYRLPIRWGDKYDCDIKKIPGLYGVGDGSNIDESLSYPHANVATQLKDKASILNYAKEANLIRLAIPQIARGDSELVYNEGNAFAVIKRTWNNESVYVVVNANSGATFNLDYSTYGNTLVTELCALYTNHVKLQSKGSTIVTIPPQSILIIK